MTDNDNYGLETEDYTVYGHDGRMKEPYISEYNKLIEGKITIDEYRESSQR
jgi:hypothetical protein